VEVVRARASAVSPCCAPLRLALKQIPFFVFLRVFVVKPTDLARRIAHERA
jgi:hypothetical protein